MCAMLLENLFYCMGTTKVQTSLSQGSHRLEKYLNIKGFIEKPFKYKLALKKTLENHSKALKSL